MSDFVLDAMLEGENDELIDDTLKDDAELERIKDRLKEVEEDAGKLHNLTSPEKPNGNNLVSI